jgi:hypothetical protein
VALTDALLKGTVLGYRTKRWPAFFLGGAKKVLRMMISRRRFLATLGAVLGSGVLVFGSAGLAQRRAGIPALKLEAGGRVAHFESAPGERVLMYQNGGAWLADGFAFKPEATPRRRRRR